MNDLLPPDRRSIPEQRRTRMRDKLDDEITSATTVSRRDNAVRRYGIPAVVAAAVAAVAFGGYLIANDDGDGDGGADPAGQGGDTRPKQQGGQTEVMEPDDAGAGPSTVLADPDQAYQKCIDMAVRQFELRGEPINEEPVGKLAIDNGTGTTVVVANSTESYTCNVKPDKAVSNPSPFTATTEARAYWFAMNYTGNVIPGEKGEYAWAGGRLPDGVTGVSYAFPDGHTEDAVVHDGFWAMQYYAEKPIAKGLDWTVDVTLDGPNGQTIPLDYTAMCNQISHGC
jgi:hypothetical protein